MPPEIKRFFLWQNAQGNETIHPSSSVRALLQKKDERGTWGSSVRGREGEGGGLVDCVELTAVMSGRKQGL